MNDIIKTVRAKDLPLEKLPEESTCYDEIVHHRGLSFIEDKNYIYTSKYNSTPQQKLGILIIDRDLMNISHALASRYTTMARAQSRRCDTVSNYQYWHQNKDKVIQLALQHLRLYKDTHTPEELPIELGGIKSDKNHIGLEHECAFALARLGNPAAFPANLMTKILDDRKGTLKILDISAGWGDRLIASCALGAHYTACDPNTALIEPHRQIIHKYGDPSKQRVFPVPFEDMIFDEMRYNCLFSSPPFFDLEIYSNEPTQSSERYRTIDVWINNFLKASLVKADKVLEQNATIYLHLNDIICDAKSSNFYVQRVIDWIISTLKWNFKGVYGFTIRDTNKRSETPMIRAEKNASLLKPTVYVKSYKEGLRCNKAGEIFTQPLWCFTKSAS
jgi:hypothetical protein